REKTTSRSAQVTGRPHFGSHVFAASRRRERGGRGAAENAVRVPRRRRAGQPAYARGPTRARASRADLHGSVAAHPEKLLRAASRHGMWTFSSSMMKPHSFGGATQLIALYQNCLV